MEPRATAYISYSKPETHRHLHYLTNPATAPDDNSRERKDPV